MAKGKLIVLEGIDGSGKSAQYRRLCARFDEMGMAYHHIVFPRYDQESSALIRMYLNGAFGAHPSDVNAYAASTFFAVDRYASYRTDWGEIYENGGLILSDRYTTSNAIHQGSKLPEAELPAFFDWLYDLEYGKMGLPRPDLVLYLDVDLPTSLKRMQHRQEKQNTKADIHEQDVSYLENCLRIGRLAAAHYGWTIVPFMKDGVERAAGRKARGDLLHHPQRAVSISGEKDALRAQLRARLSQSDPAENAACDVRITLQVLSLPAFQAAERIFAYCSVVPEVDTHAILAQARRRGKTVALPVTQPDGQMRFARL